MNSIVIATSKGLFVCESQDLRAWALRGPCLSGWEISSLHAQDQRRLLVGTAHRAYGAVIRISDDLGESWRQIECSPTFPKSAAASVDRIWEIVAGDDGALWAGTEPAGLFVSHDRGESWQSVAGLNQHPSRAQWPNSSCPQCVHSILISPQSQRIVAAISSVGILRSDDSGANWRICNTGLTPERYAHIQRVVQDPTNPNTLYLQHHDAGIFRSIDAAENWEPIHDGLPTRFGFALAVSSRGDLFAAPLIKPGRHFPDAQMRIYCRRQGESVWSPLQSGLPREPQYVGVLRSAMAVDPGNPDVVCFGTTEGQVFYSIDAGACWAQLPARLARVTALSVFSQP
jgi:photosystem II stability/assembly factor-like uncharacterized protein